MKILLVSPSFMPALNYGGTTRSIYEVCLSLSKKNTVLILATNLNGHKKLDVTPDSLQEIDGIPVIYHDINFFKKMFCSLKFLKNIFLEIPKHDVVHIQSVFFIPAIFTSLACRLLKKPFYVSTRGAVGQAVIAGKSSLAKRVWLKVLAWPLFRWSIGVHVTSSWESDGLGALGLDYGKNYLIPNGVRVPCKHLVDSAVQQLPVDDYILYVGRFSPEKGLDLLLRAYKKSNVESNLVLAGDDSNPYGAEIRELAKKLEIDAKVFFTGQVGETKWSLLKDARCLLLTSHSENFGNVVLEAMAMGTPVVVTSGVGASEVVTQTQSGYVVNRSISAVAEAIVKVIDCPDESLRLGENGKIVVQEEFSWEKIAIDYTNMYEKALQAG